MAGLAIPHAHPLPGAMNTTADPTPSPRASRRQREHQTAPIILTDNAAIMLMLNAGQHPVLHPCQPTRQIRMNHVLSGRQLPLRQLGRETDLIVGHHPPVNKLFAHQQFAARQRR